MQSLIVLRSGWGLAARPQAGGNSPCPAPGQTLDGGEGEKSFSQAERAAKLHGGVLKETNKNQTRNCERWVKKPPSP